MLHGNLNITMPLYSLPTGKVVWLSIEQILDMNDEDLQYLISTGQGADPRNPFFGSAMGNKSDRFDDEDDDESYDDGLDYEPDSDEPDLNGPIDLNNIPDEDSLID